MSEQSNETASSAPSRSKIWIGGSVALIGAGAIAVLAILPAEYWIDPTGFGKATGLTKIAEPTNIYLERGLKRQGVFTPSKGRLAPEPGASDHWEFDLGPYEGIELKYVIPEGAAISFLWSATGSLNYDMHAEPFEGGTELTESYSIEQADRLGGRYVAPFSGIHGWYWQNRSLEPVHLTLDAWGGMTGSKVFDTAGEQDRELTPVEQP